MLSIRTRILFLAAITVSLLVSTDDCYSQSRRDQRRARRDAQNQPLQLPGLSGEGFTVKGGQRFFDSASDSLRTQADSLVFGRPPGKAGQETGEPGVDFVSDSLKTTPNMVLDDEGNLVHGEFTETISRDSTFTAVEYTGDDREMFLEGTLVDTASASADTLTMSRRERRRYDRMQARLDSLNYRHHPLFRDTMQMGTNFAISLAVPGFQQFYNQQYWKIPALYAAAGTALYFGIRESRIYRTYKKDYDYLISVNADRNDINPIQSKMIQHNTRRQLFLFAALGTYVYFLGDGMLNYPAYPQDRVHIATLLSTICPGAGQIYNQSYWRVPVFFGMGAATIYIVSFNNRGYQRYKTAYQYRTDGNDATVDEFDGRLDEKYLLNLKQNYRRNRDLAIILTGLVYLFNIMDAHVDAHLRVFDISDDLSYGVKLEPMFAPVYTSRGMDAMLGMNLTITF